MATVAGDRQGLEPVARIEALLEEVEQLPDAAARETATALVQALLDLYGDGLSRIVSVVAERDDGVVADALAADELVAHLLLLHGLHPVPLETRVRDALDEVRPYLASHGGGVVLLGVEDGVARLRLEGSCDGCPSSAVTLKLAVEDAIHKAAPDVERIEAEGAPEPASPPLRIELPQAPRADPSWADAGGVADLPAGEPVLRDAVLFVRLGGRSVYAYRPTCPGCGEPLAGGALSGARLTCPGCGLRYDVHRAGRCLDAADAHLDPVPLLVDGDGRIKIALGAAV